VSDSRWINYKLLEFCALSIYDYLVGMTQLAKRIGHTPGNPEVAGSSPDHAKILHFDLTNHELFY